MSIDDYIQGALAEGRSPQEILEAVTTRLEQREARALQELLDGPTRSLPGPSATRPGPGASQPIVGLERYEDLGRIGMGGMAEVRRVRDRTLGCTLALKIIRPDLVHRPLSILRFREEAQATAQLQHPGIVPVHDLGELADGRVWFTMKEIQGQTLSRVIRSVHEASRRSWRTTPSGWNLRRLVEALVQVCEAVAYAHDRGVLHRDIKPSNIMLGRFGEVLVLDWGLVKVAGTPEGAEPAQRPVQTGRSVSGAHPTLVGDVAGTPAYMPPEQAEGRISDVDARTDVYALGAVLYTILANRAPYSGSTPMVVISKVCTEPPEPLPAGARRLDGPPLPPALVAACQRAMAREPSERFASAEAVAVELRAWLDGARRRSEALEVVKQARRRIPHADALRERAAALRIEAAEALAGIETWRPEADKLPSWTQEDEAMALEQQAELAELEVEQLLQGALTHAPELPEAHAALAERYRAQHAAAEEAQTDTTRSEMRLQQHLDALPDDHLDRHRHARYLRGDGALSLQTDPPGAEVLLHRYELHNRRLVARFERSLGPTPLREVPLPIGSYLCVLRSPGRADVRYPVHVARGEHWHGMPPKGRRPHPIRLPRLDELGPHDCYVPAGWFLCGGDPRQDRSLPAQRLWVDGRVFRRFPVTNRQYIAFLDDLLAQGREQDALQHAPREWAGASGGQGELLYGFEDGRFSLKPDADGDVWKLDWPVCMVSWENAVAYADWEAARTGQPWQLPGEIAWEKAARGVDGRFYPWGDGFDPSWTCMRLSHRERMLPAVVDSFPVDESPYGIRGMAGNMLDWCADPSTGELPTFGPAGRVPPVECDRTSPPGTYRLRRGGCWFFSASSLRATFRYLVVQSARSADLGFRLARPYP